MVPLKFSNGQLCEGCVSRVNRNKRSKFRSTSSAFLCVHYVFEFARAHISQCSVTFIIKKRCKGLLLGTTVNCSKQTSLERK